MSSTERFLSEWPFIRPTLEEEDDAEYELLRERILYLARDHTRWAGTPDNRCKGGWHDGTRWRMGGECYICTQLYGDGKRGFFIYQRYQYLEEIGNGHER